MDQAEALRWFHKAADQGNPKAHWGEAYFWFQLAHEYHTVSGKPTLDVSSEQKATAEKRVAAWKSSHAACPDECRF